MRSQLIQSADSQAFIPADANLLLQERLIKAELENEQSRSQFHQLSE